MEGHGDSWELMGGIGGNGAHEDPWVPMGINEGPCSTLGTHEGTIATHEDRMDLHGRAGGD